MLKKSCAIFLSIALAMGILVHGSFAYNSYPSGYTDVDDILSSARYGSSSDAKVQYIHEHLADGTYSNFYILSTSDFSMIYFWLAEGNVIVYNGHFYSDKYNDHFYQASFGKFNVGQSWSAYGMIANSTVEIDGVTYYQNQMTLSRVQYNNSLYNLYSSSNFYDGSVWHVPNLDISAYAYDDRVLDVYINDSILYTPYLAVRVDDMPYAFMWISVHYTDEFGNGTQIYDIYDLEYYPGDDFQLYLINPFTISSGEFTVTSVIYSGTTDWGYKEIDGLDLVFNEPLLPDPVPSITPIPDYNYFDTEIINYNGGQKDIFYNSFQVNIKRFEDSNPFYYFVDDYNYLNQPFSFNFILLPYYPVSQGFVYDEFIDDCFYQYDVILSEYYDAYFDFFYGSGALVSLQNALSSYSAGADISPALESWYSSHSPVVYTYPYFDDSDLFHLSSDMPALLVVTDSFYFKQTNYLLGDTGDILSQFSERFYKIDGFADTLFSNLLSSYNLDITFYNHVGTMLTGLSYWLNDNSLAKLSYLVNIDTDLHELLEWFQNQEDPDVILALPYFNPSLLEELYGLNIGDLIQFFNGFVQTLPSFDYSDFPNFFTYANDVVDDVAGSDNSIIDNILDPYEYDDSGLSTFGWD